MVVYQWKGFSVYADGFLKKKLDSIKSIIEKGWDCVFLIDGKERSGKSTLGFICACYLYPEMTLFNVAKSADECFTKLEKLPDKSLLMVDEGSMVFSSRDSMEKEKRKLLQVMDVVGQKNMIFIIILPSFFDLNKTIAVRRSKFLLHVYTDKKLNRGRFSYFGEHKKEPLYEYGRKHFGSYSFPRADFLGKFYNFEPFGKEYKDLKRDTLNIALSKGKDLRNIKANEDKKKLLDIYHKFNEKLPDVNKNLISEILGIGRTTLYRYLKEQNDDNLSNIKKENDVSIPNPTTIIYTSNNQRNKKVITNEDSYLY